MVIWPFKNKDTQKSMSLIILLIGIFLIAINIGNTSLGITLGGYIISYSAIGFILFMVGIIYFIPVTNIS